MIRAQAHFVANDAPWLAILILLSQVTLSGRFRAYRCETARVVRHPSRGFVAAGAHLCLAILKQACHHQTRVVGVSCVLVGGICVPGGGIPVQGKTRPGWRRGCGAGGWTQGRVGLPRPPKAPVSFGFGFGGRILLCDCTALGLENRAVEIRRASEHARVQASVRRVQREVDVFGRVCDEVE